MNFRLTEKQRIAIDMQQGDAINYLLYGGSRSAKSFTHVRTIFARASWAPGSRHLMLRYRLVHIKQSLISDTVPKVLELCYPQLHAIRNDMHHKGDGYFRLPNGSEIWYGGVDDKDRTEKLLGNEYATVFFNECSEISWGARELVMTRLAQKTSRPNPDDPDGSKGLPRLSGLRNRALYDENPPLKSHWSFKLFIEKRDPLTDKRLPDPENYQALHMNPDDNRENVAPGYIENILGKLSERQQKRFRWGQFGDAGESALWTVEQIEQCRVENDNDLPDMLRIVVAVDPSGASSPDDAQRDEIGIVIAGLGVDGIAYVLADRTIKGHPAVWGAVAVQAYDDFGADRIVGEENYGGAMVQATIQTAAANFHIGDNVNASPITVNYSSVTATRGKVVRAEPVSALYAQGKVKHVSGLTKLEDEMTQFSAFGYLGDGSPNRADACLVGSSLVETDRGLVKISEVVVGDRVLTRKGFKRVLASAQTRSAAETFDVLMSDGRSIQATAEHPVFVTGKGFVPVDSLVWGDMVEPVENWRSPCRTDTHLPSNWTGLFTPATPKATVGLLGSTTPETMISTIENSGRSITALCRRAGTFITKTLTRSTTIFSIWSLCRRAITLASTSLQSAPMNLAGISIVPGISPLSGTEAQRELLGIKSTGSAHGTTALPARSKACARGAGGRSSLAFLETRDFVRGLAGIAWQALRGDTRSTWPARSAATSLSRTNTNTSPRHAPVSVVRVCAANVEPVYNLEVEDEHEFFANGVLVHNCVWALTALFPSVIKAAKAGDALGTRPPRVIVSHAAAKQRLGFGRR